jgi:hypothetical protein
MELRQFLMAELAYEGMRRILFPCCLSCTVHRPVWVVMVVVVVYL